VSQPSAFHLDSNPIAGDASRTLVLAGFAAALALTLRRDVSTA
jgi:hypothetical protein